MGDNLHYRIHTCTD